MDPEMRRSIMRALRLPPSDKLLECIVFFAIVVPIVVISMIAVFHFATR
jgi:hypothetical protein